MDADPCGPALRAPIAGRHVGAEWPEWSNTNEAAATVKNGRTGTAALVALPSNGCPIMPGSISHGGLTP